MRDIRLAFPKTFGLLGRISHSPQAFHRRRLAEHNNLPARIVRTHPRRCLTAEVSCFLSHNDDGVASKIINSLTRQRRSGIARSRSTVELLSCNLTAHSKLSIALVA
jgi:hypothetical protein